MSVGKAGICRRCKQIAAQRFAGNGKLFDLHLGHECPRYRKIARLDSESQATGRHD